MVRVCVCACACACACACVCGQDSTQEGVFDEVKNFVQSALDGYNVSLLAYGQVFVCMRAYIYTYAYIYIHIQYIYI